jgi:pSer/pThr/pTyr-binding forkhead associated (FHA) protein
MSLQFEIIAGIDQGKKLTIHPGPGMIIGRGSAAYYQVNDPRTSRSHCEVTLQGEQVTIKCLGGSGGTFVNGQKIQQQNLKLGDVVQVGDTQLRLQVGDQPLDVALAPSRPPASPPSRRTRPTPPSWKRSSVLPYPTTKSATSSAQDDRVLSFLPAILKTINLSL